MLHITCRLQGMRPRQRQGIAVRAAFDEFLAKRVLQSAEAARNGRMVDRQHPRGSRQAATARQRQEYPDVLPVEVCAFLISH